VIQAQTVLYSEPQKLLSKFRQMSENKTTAFQFLISEKLDLNSLVKQV